MPRKSPRTCIYSFGENFALESFAYSSDIDLETGFICFGINGSRGRELCLLLWRKFDLDFPCDGLCDVCL